MVKVAPRDTAAKVKDIGPGIDAVLVYGQDSGLIKEYADKISRQIVSDLTDPFSVTQIRARDMADNPSLLLDEVNAVPMMGGRKLVRYDFSGSGNEIPGRVTTPAGLALDGASGDGLLVITVGDVKATSALVKLFEKAKNALSIVCYRGDMRDLGALFQEVLGGAGLSLSPDADSYLKSQLGRDRGITRRELEKLVLYRGEHKGQITLEEVETLIGDSSNLMLQDIAEAVSSGDLVRLEDRIRRAQMARESAVAVLRVVQQRFMRLHLVRGAMDQGQNMDAAIKALRPPLFWKDQTSFKAALGSWTSAKLSRAIQLLFQAEIDAKTTGNPADTMVARALLQIANAGRRR